MSRDQDVESARRLLQAKADREETESDEDEDEDSLESDEEDWHQLVADLRREARENPVPKDRRVDQFVFAQTIFNAKQDEHGLRMKVLRLGPADRGCVVKLSTEKGSLTAADFDSKLDRNISFEAGEREKVLLIGMRDNDTWEGIKMCPISLSVVQSVREAKVEERGGRAIILVSDTDKYPEDTEPPTIVAFLKSQRKVRGIKGLKTVACLAYMGIQSVIEGYILKTVVDTAAQDDAAFEDGAENPRERRQMRFYYCALAYFVSYLFYYGASLVFKENRGFGGTEKTLRDNLFTKFMQLSQEGVAGLGNGQFLDTAIFQVVELTNYGWKQSLAMWQCTVVIIANLLFQLYLLTNKMPLKTAVPFCLAVPTIISLVMVCTFYGRDGQKQAMVTARQDAEDEWVEFAQQAVSSRDLMVRYHVTEGLLANFRTTYTRFWKANREASTYQMHTQFIPHWFFAIGLVCVYAFVPFLVRLFAFGPGDLAALVKSWVKLNGACDKAFGSFLNMARARAALEKISDALNRTDRVSERVEYAKRVEKDSTLPQPSVPAEMNDLDVVRFEKVSYEYEEGSKIFERADAEIRCHDGGLWLLVCPVSADGSHPMGRGRRTILRMIGQLMSPTAGRLTLPAFRRIVYVDRVAIILDNSILRNLSFGRKGGLELDSRADARAIKKGLTDEEAAKDAKLRELCKWTAQAMGMSKRLYENLDKNIGGAGFDSLTTADSTGLMLSRAFLSEAEMILFDHVGGDGLGSRYMDQLQRYASGGLRLVLKEAGIGCPDSVLPPPPAVKPVVIWSPLSMPKDALARAAGVLEINEQKQLSARRLR